MQNEPSVAASAALRFLPVLFLFSGVASLAFEVVWQREMMLVLGASAPSVSAILTSFFLGLAIGSWLGGRLLLRWLAAQRSPLVFYGLVELWIGACGLLFPLLLGLANALYVSTFTGEAAVTGLASMLPRFLIAVGVALPGTIGMGATIPAMVELLDQRGRRVEASVSLAYGVNTLGGVLGACGTGFLFLPQLGMSATTWLAASLNFGIFAVAFGMERAARGSLRQRSEPPAAAPPSASRARTLTVVYTLTSFLGVGLEVVWFRMLAIFTTNSLVTFTTGLSMYLVGFAIGSLWWFPRARRKRSGTDILLTASLAAGALAIAGALLAQTTANAVRIAANGLFPFGGYGWALWIEIFDAAILMGPAAIAMGAMFPATCAALEIGSQEAAPDTGRIYSLGNLGAVLGASLTALVVLPNLGIAQTAVAYGVVYLAVAAFIAAWMSESPRRSAPLAAIALGGLALVAAWGLPPYIKAGNLVADGDRWRLQGGSGWPHILSAEVGESASVYVKEWEDGGRRVYVDDQGVAGTVLSAAVDAKMLAHIPLLLHPAPKRTLAVGFGSGGTSWSMLAHGVDTDVAEIEPAVVRAASYFESRNHGVLSHERLRVVINDARNHLLTTSRSYDVISTDVTNLQYKQNSSLYTVEYFELMRKRLRPGGIACAWIPLAGISDFELGTLLRSFQASFPEASFWFMDHTFTRFAILIGTEEPIAVDLAAVDAAFARPGVAHDLEQVGITDPLHVLQFLYLDPDAYRGYTGDGPLHTDDYPVLEFQSFASATDRGDLAARMRELRGLRAQRSAEGFVSSLGALTPEERTRATRVARFADAMRDYVYLDAFDGVAASRDDLLDRLDRAEAIEPGHPGVEQERAALRNRK